MRFEIGPGGMIVILLGLLGLSGAVFGLGLIAGHELAGPEPGAPPVAAAYPLPGAPESPVVSTAAKAPASAPAANASNDTSTDVSTAPASETTGADTAAAAVKPASAPAASLAKPIKGPVAARKLSATGATVASKGSHSRAAADEDEDLAPGSAVAPPSSGSLRQPTRPIPAPETRPRMIARRLPLPLRSASGSPPPIRRRLRRPGCIRTVFRSMR